MSILNRLIPQSKTFATSICLLACCFVVPTQTANAQNSQTSQRITTASEALQRCDLTFDGGSVHAYSETLKEVFEIANIVVMPGVEHIDMPGFALHNVSLSTAVALLDGTKGEYEGRELMLSVDPVFDHEDATGQIYVIRVHRGRQPVTHTDIEQRDPLESIQTHVWSIAHLVVRGLEPEEVLSTIEMTGELSEAAEVHFRYHEETHVLIGRGSLESLEIVDAVLRQLGESAEVHAQMMRRENAEESMVAENAVDRERYEIQMRNAEQTVAEMEFKMREYELIAREMQAEAKQLEVEVHLRNMRINGLEQKIAELQAELERR